MSTIARLTVATAFLAGSVLIKPTPAAAYDELYSGLFGGAIGAGIGYGFGGPRGAAIGGGIGLAVGFLSSHFYTVHNYEYRDDDTAYYVPYGYTPDPYLPPPPPGAYYPVPYTAVSPAVGYPVYQQPWGEPYYEAPLPPQPQENFDRSYCREFTSNITISGAKVPAHGTACRQADGVWRIVP